VSEKLRLAACVKLRDLERHLATHGARKVAGVEGTRSGEAQTEYV